MIGVVLGTGIVLLFSGDHERKMTEMDLAKTDENSKHKKDILDIFQKANQGGTKNTTLNGWKKIIERGVDPVQTFTKTILRSQGAIHAMTHKLMLKEYEKQISELEKRKDDKPSADNKEGLLEPMKNSLKEEVDKFKKESRQMKEENIDYTYNIEADKNFHYDGIPFLGWSIEFARKDTNKKHLVQYTNIEPKSGYVYIQSGVQLELKLTYEQNELSRGWVEFQSWKHKLIQQKIGAIEKDDKEGNPILELSNKREDEQKKLAILVNNESCLRTAIWEFCKKFGKEESISFFLEGNKLLRDFLVLKKEEKAKA